MTTQEARRGPGRPPTRFCACGCGERILGQRSKKYLDATHRMRGHKSRLTGRTVGPRRERAADRMGRVILELIEALRAVGTPEARRAADKAIQEMTDLGTIIKE